MTDWEIADEADLMEGQSSVWIANRLRTLLARDRREMAEELKAEPLGSATVADPMRTKDWAAEWLRAKAKEIAHD